MLRIDDIQGVAMIDWQKYDIIERKSSVNMAESKLRELSTDFAVKSIKLCETIKGHYSLVNQLELSATSIGTNIHEANYAYGKPDFTLEKKTSFV